MNELYLNEMSAREIVDLKLVYESAKHIRSQLLEMESILKNQYAPLKAKHKFQFCSGILSKNTKKDVMKVVENLVTINSNLWQNSELNIYLSPFTYIKIHYNFGGKDVLAKLDIPCSSFDFADFFIFWAGNIQANFDFYLVPNCSFLSDAEFSSLWEDIYTYLKPISNFLSSIDEESLNKRFEISLPIVEEANALKEKEAKEKSEALNNICNILNENLISFVREKSGVDYPEDLIMEALKTGFK